MGLICILSTQSTVWTSLAHTACAIYTLSPFSSLLPRQLLPPFPIEIQSFLSIVSGCIQVQPAVYYYCLPAFTPPAEIAFFYLFFQVLLAIAIPGHFLSRFSNSVSLAVHRYLPSFHFWPLTCPFFWFLVFLSVIFFFTFPTLVLASLTSFIILFSSLLVFSSLLRVPLLSSYLVTHYSLAIDIEELQINKKENIFENLRGFCFVPWYTILVKKVNISQFTKTIVNWPEIVSPRVRNLSFHF